MYWCWGEYIGDGKHGLVIGTKSTEYFGVRELGGLKEPCS